MHTVKTLREQMQLDLPRSELLQRRNGRNDVIAVGTRSAVALPHVVRPADPVDGPPAIS